MSVSLLLKAERHVLGRLAPWLALATALLFAAILLPPLFHADARRMDGTGQAYGHDFGQFWTAGRLALAGEARAVWQSERFVAELRADFPGKDFADGQRFHYPPPVLLPSAAFAMLPLTAAFPLMSLGGMALLLAALWRIMPDWRGTLLAASSPVALNALLYGQWSLWLAACLAFALLPVARGQAPHPLMSAAFVMKPTLGLALPLACLFAPGGWRRAFATVLIAAIVIALGIALFGLEPWRAFIAALPDSRAALMDQLEKFGTHSTTPGAALQSFGVSPARARLAQWAFTACGLIAAAVILASRARPDLKAATLAAAAVFAAPYCMVYDLALLIPAAFFFVRDAQFNGLHPGDRIWLAAGAILPFPAVAIQESTGMPVGFLIAFSAFAFLAARALASAAENESGSERDQEETDGMVPAQRLLQHEH